MSDEDVFELLALAQTLDALEYGLGLGPPTSFWMRISTGSSAGPVASFSDSCGGNFEVYFDRTPAVLLEDRTRYADVFNHHDGLGRKADRRPDLVVVHETTSRSERRILLVEAKLPGAEEPGTYIRQSIYKAFGYAFDFAGLWHPEQQLRIVLFVPNAITPRTEAFHGEAGGIALVSARRTEQLARAVRSVFALSHCRESALNELTTCEVALDRRYKPVRKP